MGALSEKIVANRYHQVRKMCRKARAQAEVWLFTLNYSADIVKLSFSSVFFVMNPDPSQAG